MHTAGKIHTAQLGSATMDIDDDGWQDLITGGTWYHNPGNPRRPWGLSSRSWIDDINKDGFPDIVMSDSIKRNPE